MTAGYSLFSDMTLMGTLATLRVTQIVHGKTEHTRYIEGAIRQELEKRGLPH